MQRRMVTAGDRIEITTGLKAGWPIRAITAHQPFLDAIADEINKLPLERLGWLTSCKNTNTSSLASRSLLLPRLDTAKPPASLRHVEFAVPIIRTCC
ncbi:hypothetical protein BKA23_3420 [Rudaeicoccus suwonensis]|uniref:Uncharacterized protein n=1 Tax=Rudaeicoccus suwonensis TaxID=657409 RepID=A0A561DVL6_9MICO|nr:hypothetical protein BKA23_3420 [Rudaeicoccus suwonensis]